MKFLSLDRRPRRHALAAGLLAALATMGAAQAAQGLNGLRVFRETDSSNPQSPSHLARTVDASVAAGSSGYTGAEVNLGFKEGGLRVESTVVVLGRGDSRRRSGGRFNELFVSRKQGGLQISAGRRVVDWDVGFGFRPNDLVMMDTTRPLSPTPRKGKYLLQLDYFGQAATVSVVWLNPQNSTTTASLSKPAQEGAWAGQVYRRVGGLDVYGFGRYGLATGSSAGMAMVGVPSDAITLQGSVRLIRNYNGLAALGPAQQIYSESPWSVQSRRNVLLSSLGMSWAGSAKQSVFIEYWYDGRAPSNAQWNQWNERGLWLRQATEAWRNGLLPVPALALAGNLAWQEVLMTGLNQRRENILLRLAWQPEDFAFSFDTVYSLADGGLNHTLTAQWLTPGLTLSAAARWVGGPANSVGRQLPVGTSGVLSAAWTF